MSVRLEVAARNTFIRIPAVAALIASGRIPRGQAFPDGWVFPRKPYAAIDSLSYKALVVISKGPSWQGPNEHNTARFPTLYVDVWASPSRAANGTPIRDDADDLILEVEDAFLPHFHTVDLAVPGRTGEPLDSSQGLPGFSRVWGTAAQVSARTGAHVVSSELLEEPDYSDVSDGNGARMARYSFGVQVV